ncbi:MAG: class IV adenylate cyclase [Chloroflexota bacterium]
MDGRETEVKFYVQDLKKCEARLRDMKARLIQPRVFETNLRFDLPDGSLRAEGRVLRLRKSNDIRLTYKGSSENRDGILTRAEIEFTTDDFEAARQFILGLGYQVVATYEKYRTTYQVASLHVMLDELPYGSFVEIEGENETDIRQMAIRLGLDWEAAVPASYLALFERICGRYRLDPSRLTFDALGDIRPTAEELAVVPAD